MQITVILIVLASGLALVAMLYTIHLLLPGPVEKARSVLESSLGKSFLLGLINILFAGVIVFLLLRGAQMVRAQGSGGAAILAGILAVLAFLIVLAVAILVLNGLVALASLLGTRLYASRPAPRGDLWGGLLLVLAILTPYLGWLLFAPAMISMGLGATILSLFQRKPAPVS